MQNLAAEGRPRIRSQTRLSWARLKFIPVRSPPSRKGWLCNNRSQLRSGRGKASGHLCRIRACPRVARAQLTLQWETEPGWVQLSFGAPALCAVANEIGGRCEIRAVADQLANGEYFGSEHLSFVSVGRWITVYATEMRQLQFVCYLLYPEVVDCLTPVEKAAIYRAPSRYMFKNERLAICAGLLNDCGREAATQIVTRRLSRAPC